MKIASNVKILLEIVLFVKISVLVPLIVIFSVLKARIEIKENVKIVKKGVKVV